MAVSPVSTSVTDKVPEAERVPSSLRAPWFWPSVKEMTGASLTGKRLSERVALGTEPPLPSLIVNAKVTKPLKLRFGVKI